MYNGTQPSNGGCTNGTSSDAVNCGLGTALLDCDSDLSTPIFTWSKAELSSNQVSTVFRFDQQINLAVIRMCFWNSISDSVTVPNVKVYWSDDDSIAPSNRFLITHNTSGSDAHVLTINIGYSSLKFRYLKIEMSFVEGCRWIILSEVEFCGEKPG